MVRRCFTTVVSGCVPSLTFDLLTLNMAGHVVTIPANLQILKKSMLVRSSKSTFCRRLLLVVEVEVTSLFFFELAYWLRQRLLGFVSRFLALWLMHISSMIELSRLLLVPPVPPKCGGVVGGCVRSAPVSASPALRLGR